MTNLFAPRRYGALERVTARVYVFRNIVNSIIVLGDAATAVIDTQVNEPMATRLLQAVRSLSEKPLRYVVNTHYHWDHTAGNHVMQQTGASIVSSALTHEFMQTRQARQRAFLESRGFELSPLPCLADTIVTESTALDLGNQRLCLQHLGKAETDDALAVHLPQEACVIVGDTVMTGSFPIFGQPVMNEGLMGTTEWLDTLDTLERLQPTYILPGHGPVARQVELALFRRLQQYFLQEVAARVAQQMPLLELLAEVEGRLPEWITDIPVVWGTPRYAILRVYRGLVQDPHAEPGWQHLKPSAIPAENTVAVATKCAGVSDVTMFQEVAREFAEGGDVGSVIAVARCATVASPDNPATWVWLADCLVRGAESTASVLEKGDFFYAARQALQRALALDPDHAAAHLACGRLLVMAAFRNGGNAGPGLAHLQRVIESIAVPARGPAAALLAQAHFYTRLGYRTHGDESQARTCFRTALTHLPTFQPAVLALQAPAM